MPKPSNTKLPSGPDCWSNARVMLCNHAGWFTANVFITPFAVTVVEVKGKPVTSNTVIRKELDTAHWHITDENGGYWGEQRGVFVLPRESLTKL